MRDIFNNGKKITMIKICSNVSSHSIFFLQIMATLTNWSGNEGIALFKIVVKTQEKRGFVNLHYLSVNAVDQVSGLSFYRHFPYILFSSIDIHHFI